MLGIVQIWRPRLSSLYSIEQQNPDPRGPIPVFVSFQVNVCTAVVVECTVGLAVFFFVLFLFLLPQREKDS